MCARCLPQVLHTRSCSGLGQHFVRFLAACYLCFNMDHSSVTLAMASMSPIMPPRRFISGAHIAKPGNPLCHAVISAFSDSSGSALPDMSAAVFRATLLC